MSLDAKNYANGAAIYTFVDRATGENINLDAEALRKWCLASTLEVTLTPIKPEIAVTFVTDNVISLEHVKRVLAMPKLDPIIYCITGYGPKGYPDVMLADGHHRYFCAWLARSQLIPAYLVPEKDWRPFQIIGLPDVTENQLKAMPISKDLKVFK